ncbi:MAG: type VI secretion system tube protein Hcp [Acetobacteraceae bacterium]|nr:type VI secretion system tube protein Hcp [Acetobacteraceae bacterium]
MPIYMNYNEGALKGDVTETGHKEWIEVNSFQWGVGRGISSPTGGSADRESSAPSISEIVVTKPQDISSVGLLTEAYQGDGVKVQLDFCRTNKDQMQVYLTIELENVMISGYSVSSGGDRPQESISLNFTKITYKGTQMKPDGSGAGPANISYDLATAVAA